MTRSTRDAALYGTMVLAALIAIAATTCVPIGCIKPTFELHIGGTYHNDRQQPTTRPAGDAPGGLFGDTE